MEQKLIKTHKNIKKNSKNDIRSDKHFEVILLKKLIFV